MEPMKCYGWIVTVERCSHLETDTGNVCIFNVNLARPWSNGETSKNFPRGPDELPNASTRLGDLLYPWEWNYKPAGWRYFGSSVVAGKPPIWKELKGLVKEGVTKLEDNVVIGQLQNVIRKEVEDAGENCKYPFSQGLEDFWIKKERSYVHSLAPLTHWPALMSEALLHLSFFVSIDAADVVGITGLACFPEFDINASSLIASRALRLNGDALEPPDNPITGGNKLEVVASYTEPAVAFLCLAGTVTQDKFTSKENLRLLSQGFASRSSVHRAVWDYLLPAQILRRWLEANIKAAAEVLKEAAVRKTMPKLLWEALGTGNEPQAQGVVNVLEFLVDKKDGVLARKLRHDLKDLVLAEDAAVTALLEAAETLAKPRTVKGAKVWATADIDRWQQRIKYFKIMTIASTSNEEEFKTAWLGVAESVLSDDQVSELYGPWLAFALSSQLSATLGADWDKIRDKLLTHGEVRSDHWTRARAGGITTGQWEAAEKIVVGLDIADADLKHLVDETMSNINVKLKFRNSAEGDTAYSLLLLHGLEAFVISTVIDWHEFMKQSVQRSRRRPRDRGLRLDFSHLVGDPQRPVQAIRGYAIALCAGTRTPAKPWTPDLGRACWLTDTALYFNDGTGKWDWLKSGGKTAWMHDTVGATFNDGELLLSVEYEGAPLATTLSNGDHVFHEGQEKDEDGFKAVEFAWHSSSRSLPLLGYGLLYKAAITPLDNAGGVIDVNFRSSAVAELKAAHDLKVFDNNDKLDAFHYRSSEPPGAPSLLKVPAADYYELSEETQAHAWQSRMAAHHETQAQAWQSRMAAHKEMQPDPGISRTDADRPKKVALLAYPQAVDGHSLFPKVPASCTMDVVPPTTHFVFIERWLNTDRVLIEQKRPDLVSDTNLAKFSSVELAAFVERFRERKEKDSSIKSEKVRYQPAVTAIGVEAWSPRRGAQFLHLVFDRLVDGKLEPNQFKFALEVHAAPASNDLNLKLVGGGMQMSVPQGEFVRLRLFSLVENKYFKNSDTDGRFIDGIQLQLSELPDLPKELNDFAFAAFGPTEYWFETIPEWNPALVDNPVTVTLTAPSEEIEEVDKAIRIMSLSPNLLTAKIDFQTAPWASWVKGLLVQRHEWHWTGYPIEFPRMAANLNSWLPSLAGVESFREVVDSPLTSSFSAKYEWMIGPEAGNTELFYRQELPAGRRTSRYAALFVRPMVRFRRWLNPKLDTGPTLLEGLIWGDGKIVPGRGQPGENARLFTPVLRHSIPLTSTYADTAPLEREANGVLLIFDEAIRRTDDLAKVGGLGDVLELDLVETRFSKFKEIGNNPIMHGIAGRWTDKTPLALMAKSPFGLTFDIGANAKVAQTAMVVQPLNGGGHWLLAKARVRRMVLPETELGTLIKPTEPPDEADASMAWYKLLNRLQGDEAIIPDIAIDVTPKTSLEVQFLIDTTDGLNPLAITMPNRTEGDIRYVLSWHKGRWDTATPGWRCQVLAQARHSEKLNWRVIEKISCHQNTAELPRGFKKPTAYVGLSLQNGAKVRRIRLSEYTDPVWLTFIGSFGEQKPASNTDFVFDAIAGQLRGLRPKEGNNAAPPRLRGLDESLNDPTQPSFHLVLVFRPTDDLTRGHSRGDSGILVGAYWARKSTLTYLPKVTGEIAPDLEGCHAQVIALQRITALTVEEKAKLEGIVTFTDFLEKAFPNQDTIQESLIRFLPEFLGPIQIVNRAL